MYKTLAYYVVSLLCDHDLKRTLGMANDFNEAFPNGIKSGLTSCQNDFRRSAPIVALLMFYAEKTCICSKLVIKQRQRNAISRHYGS